MQFDNVRLRFEKKDLRPVLICTGVERLILEDFKFPRLPEVTEAIVLNDTTDVHLGNSDFFMIEPNYNELKFMADSSISKIRAGELFQVRLVVENGRKEGLAKIGLVVAEQKIIRWLWLRAGEKKEVVFKGLTAPDAGTYQIRCGNISQNLQVEK